MRVAQCNLFKCCYDINFRCLFNQLCNLCKPKLKSTAWKNEWMNCVTMHLCVGCVLLVIDELSTSVDATNGWETNRTHTKTYVVSVVSLRSQFTYLPFIAIWIWITICMCAVHSVYIAHYQFTNIPNLWCLIIFYDNFFQFSTTDSISRITI